MSTPTRFKVAGAEVLGVGAFLLFSWFLGSTRGYTDAIESDFPIVGAVLILLGVQILSLIRELPASSRGSQVQRARPAAPDGEVMEGTFMSVRKLVALDMLLHGQRLILLEFAIGTPVMIAFGLFVISRGSPPVGAYFLSLGINYLPLLIYALGFRLRGATVAELNQNEKRAYARRYGAQQLLLLVPFAVALLASAQWLTTRNGNQGT